MTFFLSQVVDYNHPSVEVREGVLTGVFEVGSRQVLCHDAVVDMQEYLEEQCFRHWGEDMLMVDIPIPNAVLFYDNGAVRFGPRDNFELPAGVAPLISPAVSVRFYNDNCSTTVEP